MYGDIQLCYIKSNTPIKYLFVCLLHTEVIQTRGTGYGPLCPDDDDSCSLVFKNNSLPECCLEFQAHSSAADRFTSFGHKHIHLYKHHSTHVKGTTLSALTFIESQSERLSKNSSIWLSVTALFEVLVWISICMRVCACNGGHDCSVPTTSRAGMCIMIN